MTLPTKAPTVESTMPKPKAPEKIPPAKDTSPKPAPVSPPKTPRDGTRPKENPGAVVYRTGMIRVSKILAPKPDKENPNAVPMDIDERRSPFFP